VCDKKVVGIGASQKLKIFEYLPKRMIFNDKNLLQQLNFIPKMKDACTTWETSSSTIGRASETANLDIKTFKKRFGTPENCAKVVEFLCIDLSDYVTGQVIGIDGGTVLAPH